MIADVGWGVLLAAAVCWGALGARRRRAGVWSTSERYAAVRWIAYGAWLWLGWHVFVRTWGMFR